MSSTDFFIAVSSDKANGLIVLGLFVLVAFCVCLQMNYLNKALDLFSTSVVTPIYYVLFTSLVIGASGILFDEWKNMLGNDILACVCGFLVTVIAIYMVCSFKDVYIHSNQTVSDTRNYGSVSYGPGRNDSYKA